MILIVNPINEDEREEEEEGGYGKVKHLVNGNWGLEIGNYHLLISNRLIYTTLTVEPRPVFSTSMRFGKASLSSSRWVMMKILAKSFLTVLMASIKR